MRNLGRQKIKKCNTFLLFTMLFTYLTALNDNYI
jgi:hypothetical protein